MESKESEVAFINPEIYKIAEEKLVAEAVRLVPSLLSEYVTDPEFSLYSDTIKARLSSDIAGRSRSILYLALVRERQEGEPGEFEIHDTLCISRPEDFDLEPKIILEDLPELPDDILESCVKTVHGLNIDSTELENYHDDYLQSPELFNLIISTAEFSRTHETGSFERLYLAFKNGLFSSDYTLREEESLSLLDYMPNDVMRSLSMFLVANQTIKNMEIYFDESELSEDEAEVYQAFKDVFAAEVLTADFWTEFAAEYNYSSISQPGMFEISYLGLVGLRTIKQAMQTGKAYKVFESYLDSIKVILDSMGDPNEQDVDNDISKYAVNGVSGIFRYVQKSAVYRTIVQNQERDISSSALVPKNAYMAVISESNTEHAVMIQDIVNRDTELWTNDDYIHSDISSLSESRDFANVASMFIEFDSGDILDKADRVVGIVKRRLAGNNTEFPDLTIRLWSADYKTVEMIKAFFQQLADRDEILVKAFRNGNLLISDCSISLEYGARVNLIIGRKIFELEA